MQIGSFKPNNGTLFGSISTANLHLPRLGLKPVQSNHERAPAFEVMALNPARRWVQIGALWEATANSTGETFYQGQVDDPSFNAPLPIALFGDGEEGFNVAWNRRRKRQDDTFNDAEGAPDESEGSPFGPEPGSDPAPRRARRSRRADSFEGNADDSGNLTERQDTGEHNPF